MNATKAAAGQTVSHSLDVNGTQVTVSWQNTTVPPPPPPPPPPTSSTLLGFFAGNGSAGQDVVNQLAVLGTRPAAICHVFNSFWKPSYADIGDNYSPVNGQGKPLAAGQRLLITVPLCATGTDGTPVTGMLLSDTITASNLQQYFIMGQKLVAAGCANAIVRLGHECNGGWYGWAHQGRTLYKEAFQAVVEIMRTVPGQEFLFEWNVNGGWAPLTSSQPNPGTPFQDAAAGESWQQTYLGWYPGTQYVDILGQDAYVGQWSVGLTDTPPNTGWMAAVNDALVMMAVQLGKAWGISEYGSLFGDNPQTTVNGKAIDGDAMTALFITDTAIVVKGQRPASAWDVQIGGWTAATPPPPAMYSTLYNWTGDAPYMTTGSPTALNPAYAKSDAAFKAAWG